MINEADFNVNTEPVMSLKRKPDGRILVRWHSDESIIVFTEPAILGLLGEFFSQYAQEWSVDE